MGLFDFLKPKPSLRDIATKNLKESYLLLIQLDQVDQDVLQKGSYCTQEFYIPDPLPFRYSVVAGCLANCVGISVWKTIGSKYSLERCIEVARAITIMEMSSVIEFAQKHNELLFNFLLHAMAYRTMDTQVAGFVMWGYLDIEHEAIKRRETTYEFLKKNCITEQDVAAFMAPYIKKSEEIEAFRQGKGPLPSLS